MESDKFIGIVLLSAEVDNPLVSANPREFYVVKYLLKPVRLLTWLVNPVLIRSEFYLRNLGLEMSTLWRMF